VNLHADTFVVWLLLITVCDEHGTRQRPDNTRNDDRCLLWT